MLSALLLQRTMENFSSTVKGPTVFKNAEEVFLDTAVFTLEAGPKRLTSPKKVKHASLLLASKS